MGPFSHYYLAAKLQTVLQPEDVAEYLWGAVVPDIRYLAQLRREHTHVGQVRLDQWRARYPHLKSFLLGYQVHCGIDQIDVAALLRSAFPFNVLRLALWKRIFNFSVRGRKCPNLMCLQALRACKHLKFGVLSQPLRSYKNSLTKVDRLY